jgi:hypothetical protein
MGLLLWPSSPPVVVSESPQDVVFIVLHRCADYVPIRQRVDEILSYVQRTVILKDCTSVELAGDYELVASFRHRRTPAH